MLQQSSASQSQHHSNQSQKKDLNETLVCHQVSYFPFISTGKGNRPLEVAVGREQKHGRFRVLLKQNLKELQKVQVQHVHAQLQLSPFTALVFLQTRCSQRTKEYLRQKSKKIGPQTLEARGIAGPLFDLRGGQSDQSK